MIARRSLLASALATPLAAPALGQAQWPPGNVRMIVPWPAGGSTDVLVRLYAERLGPILGTNVVIENRSGAGGNIGLDALAKSAPDGSTFSIASVGHLCINPFLYARLPYDPAKDLQPVAIAWDLPNVAVVAAQHNPAKTLAEFIAGAKAKRGGISYGSPGVGTTPHLSGALFAARTGIEATHVPFRGAAQTIPAMLSGDLDFALDNLASYVPVIQEGRMRALAVTSAERFPTVPDVPTMAEAGVPNMVLTSWQGFVAPAGTPRAITERLGNALRQVANDEGFKDRVLRAGALAVWSSPDGMSERANQDRPLWQEAVRVSGARVE
ncbi:tripartite tricarboxylate transporter substrate binding protein [Falsiroseomonas bella]|uniref:Tripartite tricarboxylate transporter substrate binding protein n=1 Tax=Falsiroseomonas bella TaxID=2184016 RepID=A0A317FIN4_9PROT|nr:tripartite tricarboxylate transporter substrate binding protein [Falsiroseomonas bella]PWS37937.1 tripartite tricarboxylate transporter substrate binding protein [Falsiroseomonas bella]